MKISILMENTCGDTSYEYEHGLSVYVETEKHRLLLDSGASDKTWKNAESLGIDLKEVDMVVLSHGHYDHSGGLLSFREINKTAPIYMQITATDDYYHGERYIGIDKRICQLENIQMIRGNKLIDDEVYIFSGIEGRRLWPASNRALSKKIGDLMIQDEFDHEQCLVIHARSEDSDVYKNVLISGCAHNGILNILDHYYEIYSTYPDLVISGFHMMKKDDYTELEKNSIQATARELAQLPTVFYSGHCTGEKAMGLMKPIMGDKLQALHSGMQLNF